MNNIPANSLFNIWQEYRDFMINENPDTIVELDLISQFVLLTCNGVVPPLFKAWLERVYHGIVIENNTNPYPWIEFRDIDRYSHFLLKI
jgi:hypothetical protein